MKIITPAGLLSQDSLQMQPSILWERVIGNHPSPVSHKDLGCFGIDLLATSDKRTFLLLDFLPDGSIGNLPEERSGSGLSLLRKCIHHNDDLVIPAVGAVFTRTQKPPAWQVVIHDRKCLGAQKCGFEAQKPCRGISDQG